METGKRGEEPLLGEQTEPGEGAVRAVFRPTGIAKDKIGARKPGARLNTGNRREGGSGLRTGQTNLVSTALGSCGGPKKIKQKIPDVTAETAPRRPLGDTGPKT